MTPVVLDAWKYRLPEGKDDRIALRLAHLERNLPQLGRVMSLHYDILDLHTGKRAGRLGVRLGESESLFYLGHVGYSVSPDFRGQGYAYRACTLCLPLFPRHGMRSLCITTDEDNLPSIRTCEKLGCRYESTVEVPPWCRRLFEISPRKRRYILLLA
ncbi:MAG: GNAT family N-acetyltransferase [Candidatus Limiplasma sp.]|nr:GNAT family N-acetyltransferase [Candidatus Limiplasma sp.]